MIFLLIRERGRAKDAEGGGRWRKGKRVDWGGWNRGWGRGLLGGKEGASACPHKEKKEDPGLSTYY